MLRHEEVSEAISEAAQVRVTPERLVAAVSRIEERKTATSIPQDDKIALGVAVQELYLDTTPEEILAEIQRQQTIRQEQARLARIEATQQARRLRSLSAVLVLSLCVNLWVGLAQTVHPASTVHTLPVPPATAVIQGNQHRMSPLSEVPEEEHVYVSYTDIRRLLRGVPPEYILAGRVVSLNGAPGFVATANGPWSIFKHKGRMYLDAYPLDHPVRLKNGVEINYITSPYSPVQYHGTSIELPVHKWHNRIDAIPLEMLKTLASPVVKFDLGVEALNLPEHALPQIQKINAKLHKEWGWKSAGL